MQLVRAQVLQLDTIQYAGKGPENPGQPSFNQPSFNQHSRRAWSFRKKGCTAGEKAGFKQAIEVCVHPDLLLRCSLVPSARQTG